MKCNNEIEKQLHRPMNLMYDYLIAQVERQLQHQVNILIIGQMYTQIRYEIDKQLVQVRNQVSIEHNG